MIDLRARLRRDRQLGFHGQADVIFGDFKSFSEAVRAAPTIDDGLAGTVNAAVLRRRGRSGDSPEEGLLQPGDRLVRVSHQPNLWAGLNIAGLLRLAGLAGGPGTKVLYVAIDYDAAGDQRLRSGTLPDVERDRLVRLGGMIPPRQRLSIPAVIPAASEAVLSRHVQTTRQLVRAARRRARRCGSALDAPIDDDLDRYVEVATSASRLADGMARGLADWAERHFAVSISTVMASDLVAVLSEEVLALLPPMIEIGGLAPKRAAWRICPNCNDRCDAEIEATQSDLPTRWSCSRCQLGRTEPLSFAAEPGNVAPFLPRVDLCDAIDIQLLGQIGSVSYAGGVEHAYENRVRHLRAEVSGLPPEYSWDPEAMFHSWSEATDLGDTTAAALKRGRLSSWWYSMTMGDAAVIDAIGNSTNQQPTSNEGITSHAR